MSNQPNNNQQDAKRHSGGGRPERQDRRGRGRGRGRGGRPRNEFDQKVIDIARVTRVVAGGRRFRFRATVAIGDRNGKVGVALGKGGDVSVAIQKAVDQAKKHMIQVPVVGGTIPYETQKARGGAVVFLKPAVEGTGIIAGGPVRAVIELAGVHNILSKMLGSNNKTNNAIATYEALHELQSAKDLMDLRGKELPKPKKKAQAKAPKNKEAKESKKVTA